MTKTDAPLLAVRDLHTYYGKIHALKGISFHVNRGEIVTLIGGNGAGKTTTLHSVSLLLKPRSGDIVYAGQPITGLPPHKVVGLGMAHVPEGRRIFPEMTVRENLEVGAFLVKNKRVIKDRMANVFELFPRLKERVTQQGGTLSGGEQQMLAVARALMQEPELILLDEPSMGLSPIFVETIFDILKTLNQNGKTILLVEQNALMALGIAHRGYVLQTGSIVLEDSAAKLAANEAVRKAYLGEE
ncbi:MAG: ABC transporter ATP-binding protein [Gammaproteobacteria bacterium]|nr:ABC transporter ATP-binding protein [Gammaproteobacteria bacterium]